MRAPGRPLTSVCGVAQGEPRGQAARGSNRGYRRYGPGRLGGLPHRVRKLIPEKKFFGDVELNEAREPQVGRENAGDSRPAAGSTGRENSIPTADARTGVSSERLAD